MYPYKTNGVGLKSIGSKMQINPGNAVNTGELHIDAATVGINTTSPQAYLHISGATEQLRLGYDSTNYTSFIIDSAGELKIDNFDIDYNILLLSLLLYNQFLDIFDLNVNLLILHYIVDYIVHIHHIAQP